MKGAFRLDITNNIMVCVTQQKTCERLINRGEALKQKYNGDLFVIHAAKEGTNFLGNQHESDALEYLYDISKNAGAEMTVLRSKDVPETLLEFAKVRDIKHIVMGEAPSSNKENDIAGILQKNMPECIFYIVPSNQ
jgi:K+-sensing histidine kinase KdpD